MPSYEAMFIFRPALSEEERKQLVAGLENILKENQAVIESSSVFGRRSLAYEIDKCKEGFYYLINFSSPSGTVVSRLNKACNINEQVLRVLIVQRKAQPKKP